MVTRVELTQEETGSLPPQEQTPDYSAEPGRPEWLPSNFKNVEDYVRSSEETKAALTRTQQELAQYRGDETPPSEDEEGQHEEEVPKDQLTEEEEAELEKSKQDTEAEDDAAEKLADKAGFDLAPYSDEFWNTGDVTEENRAAIAEGLKGVLGDEARKVVDSFIDSRKVLKQNDDNLFMEAAGGEDSFKAMIAWAGENLPKEQIDAYNHSVNSGDRHSRIFAIEGLKAKYELANGVAPQRRVSGKPSTSPSVPAFKSTAEMSAAMKDPRYKTDQAYRDMVRARIAVSDNI